MPTIHPTAIVSSEATIGESVEIGPFAVVESDVVIGEGTSIGPHCKIDNGARIGKNCTIHQGTVVATPPQDLKYAGEKTEFFIGDNTVVREYCTLNRGTTHSWKSQIGSNCLLMAYAHVAHDCIVGDNVVLANAVQLGGHTYVHDFATIGGVVAVHQFSTVGAYAMVGGGIRVLKDVPPFVLASDTPARFERLNAIGLRRRGFSADTRSLIDEAYRIIYRSGRNVSQAVEYISNNLENTKEIQMILDFIAASRRGIISASRS